MAWHRDMGTWCGNTLVAFNKDLFTLRPNGILEIRGTGWGPTRRNGNKRKLNDGSDLVRTYNLRSAARAKRVAEFIVQLMYEEEIKAKEKTAEK